MPAMPGRASKKFVRTHSDAALRAGDSDRAEVSEQLAPGRSRITLEPKTVSQLASQQQSQLASPRGCSSWRCFALRVPGGKQVDGLPPASHSIVGSFVRLPVSSFDCSVCVSGCRLSDHFFACLFLRLFFWILLRLVFFMRLLRVLFIVLLNSFLFSSFSHYCNLFIFLSFLCFFSVLLFSSLVYPGVFLCLCCCSCFC